MELGTDPDMADDTMIRWVGDMTENYPEFDIRSTTSLPGYKEVVQHTANLHDSSDYNREEHTEEIVLLVTYSYMYYEPGEIPQ